MLKAEAYVPPCLLCHRSSAMRRHLEAGCSGLRRLLVESDNRTITAMHLALYVIAFECRRRALRKKPHACWLHQLLSSPTWGVQWFSTTRDLEVIFHIVRRRHSSDLQADARVRLAMNVISEEYWGG